jgi:hypothetical protein
LNHYKNIVTLDLSDQKFIKGKYPFRSVILVSMRLLLTLLIEGIIFYLFRYRKRQSWLVFLGINLITQGMLNIWLNSVSSLMTNYLIITLIIGEIFVFIAEMMAFPIFIKEHRKRRIIIFVMVANLLSLIAGGYIIELLPV